jgi:hypothetical protein
MLIFSQQKKLYLGSSFLLCLIFVWHAWFFYPNLFFFDDPYIVLHSVQVLHLGYDPNYLGSPALTGNSSPVHLALTYLLSFVLSPLNAILVTNWIATLTYAWGIIYLAQLYRATTIQIILLLICGLLSHYGIMHLLNGLETSLALSAIVWTLILASLPITTTRRISFALVLGTLPFIRPELAALSGSLYLYQLYRYHETEQFSWKWLIQDCSYVLLAALPWLIWTWLDMHQLYASTISAKNAFFADNYPTLGSRLYATGKILLSFFANPPFLFFPGLILLCFTRLGLALLLFILILITSYTLIAPHMLNQNEFRYLTILVPLFLFGYLSNFKRVSIYSRYAVNGLLIYLSVLILTFLPVQLKCYELYLLTFGNNFPVYTKWCLEHIPLQETLIIQDAGYIAYATPFHLIDFVGLKTPSNIPIHQKLTLPSHGKLRNEAISQIIQQNHAHYLIMTADWTLTFHTIEALKALGWHVKLLKDFSWKSLTSYQIFYVWRN